MKALDLFCGATGGWHFGFNAAGIDVVAGCEFDPWRRAVYAARYGVPVYPDVRTLTGEQVTRDHGPIDIVCGSPPCQDASSANAKGKGVDGERTGLFFDAIRIAGELRPRWVCLENVPGLRARGYDRVHDALEALGYEVRPVVVGAWHAGAPHRRNRVVVVASLPAVFRETVAGCQSDRVGTLAVADADETGRGRLGAPARHGHEPQGGVASNAAGAGLAIRQDERRDGDQEQPSAIGAMLARWSGWNGGPPALGGMDDGVSAALAARRGLGRACLAAYGDSFVPIFPELIGRFIRHTDAQGLTP
ncbi:MAG: DNA cytosine methyltransferase [Alphaproteobacteria bacterium]|nr:DNA cytosine methyltransferase [Alphaproteobacteria bacterium]